jgi:hypothetical protein
MDIQEINFVIHEICQEFSCEFPGIEESSFLRQEGVRACYLQGLIQTSEPDNLVLTLHEVVHYLHDEIFERDEDDQHGEEFLAIADEVSRFLQIQFGLFYSIDDILNVPFGDEFC